MRLSTCVATLMNCLLMHEVEVLHSKFLKTALGIKYSSRLSPLLQALNIDRVCTSLDVSKLSLFRSTFMSNSKRTQSLYKFFLNQCLQGNFTSYKNLTTSILHIVTNITYHLQDISVINHTMVLVNMQLDSETHVV